MSPHQQVAQVAQAWSSREVISPYITLAQAQRTEAFMEVQPRLLAVLPIRCRWSQSLAHHEFSPAVRTVRHPKTHGSKSASKMFLSYLLGVVLSSVFKQEIDPSPFVAGANPTLASRMNVRPSRPSRFWSGKDSQNTSKYTSKEIFQRYCTNEIQWNVETFLQLFNSSTPRLTWAVDHFHNLSDQFLGDRYLTTNRGESTRSLVLIKCGNCASIILTRSHKYTTT